MQIPIQYPASSLHPPVCIGYRQVAMSWTLRLEDGDALRRLLSRSLRERDGEHTILHARFDIFLLDTLTEPERPLKLAERPLPYGIPILLAVRGDVRLTGDCEAVIVQLDVHVFLLEPGKLEGSGDGIILALMYVHLGTERLTSGYFAVCVHVTTRETSEERVIKEALKLGEGVIYTEGKRHVVRTRISKACEGDKWETDTLEIAE